MILVPAALTSALDATGLRAIEVASWTASLRSREPDYYWRPTPQGSRGKGYSVRVQRLVRSASSVCRREQGAIPL